MMGTLSKKKRLLFALLPLATLLMVAEVAARLWLHSWATTEQRIHYAVPAEFPTAAKYAPHHYLGYALQPNYVRGKTSHNSLGLRGKEIPRKKPPGTFRVAILGGSTTYTEFVNDNDATFPARLEQELQSRHPHSRIEVINAGCPGYNSWESLIQLQFRVLDLAPDLVILYEGVNDVHARLVLPLAYRGDNSGRRVPWSEPIEVRLCRFSLLSRMVGHHLGWWRIPGVDSYVQAPTCDPGVHGPSAAIGGDPESVLAANPPDFFRRNLRNMVVVARANGAEVLMATWAHSPHCGDYAATPHYEAGFMENNEVVREIAYEQSADLYDFAAEMPGDRCYWRDGRHVNESGAKLQAKLFADHIDGSGLLDDRNRDSGPLAN